MSICVCGTRERERLCREVSWSVVVVKGSWLAGTRPVGGGLGRVSEWGRCTFGLEYLHFLPSG